MKLRVEVPLVSNSECSTTYGKLGMIITDRQLCAGGAAGKDSCTGDSGGPLMTFKSDEEVWYAEGIVSYGAGCGRAGWPGVYTGLPFYYDWIVDNIKQLKKVKDV